MFLDVLAQSNLTSNNLPFRLILLCNFGDPVPYYNSIVGEY